MSRTSTDLRRLALNGPTMGSRWSAVLYAPPGLDAAPLQAALQAAVDEVDAQMSTWRADSALMALNAAAVGPWLEVPARLWSVLDLGLRIGRLSGGAFDIGTHDAVRAWGFGPEAPDPAAIRAAMTAQRPPAHEVVELEPGRLRKLAPVAFDLNGIAKGYGVDRLAEVVAAHGIASALLAIDGELRALGPQPGGRPWSVAVEAPDPERRAPHAMLQIEGLAVATSGDYRHWVEVGGRRLSHSLDPRRGAPLQAPPASVTVLAPRCAEADAWATALMVAGSAAGAEMARQHDLSALFLDRAPGGGLTETRVGVGFAG